MLLSPKYGDHEHHQDENQLRREQRCPKDGPESCSGERGSDWSHAEADRSDYPARLLLRTCTSGIGRLIACHLRYLSVWCPGSS